MKTEIQNKLRQIEEHYKVKVLYACETGSRAWGFPSPDSDYDVRVIYVHEPDWYLSLSEGKDTIEVMDGDLDITGWDFRKCLRLLWKSNGALLERIQSPIVYKNTEGLIPMFKEHADKCFAPIAAMHHYLGMARTSFDEVENKENVKLKKLFYSLRATLACKWIVDKNDIPPIVFATMVNELDFDHVLKVRIKDLVELKSGKNESYIHDAEPELNSFIRTQLDLAEGIANDLKGRKDKDVDLDLFFRKIIKENWK